MLHRIFTAVLIALAPVVVSVAPPVLAAAADTAFDTWFVEMGRQAAADPQYKRIPLDTKAQAESFVTVTRRLYNGEITPDQYGEAVDTVYPGHRYEIDFIINHLPAR